MRSGVMPTSILRLFTITTGASPHAPKHSPSLSVNLPSAVVSFQPMPSRRLRCAAASPAPESAQGRLVQNLFDRDRRHAEIAGHVRHVFRR